jgi:hypothetical protein
VVDFPFSRHFVSGDLETAWVSDVDFTRVSSAIFESQGWTSWEAERKRLISGWRNI